MPEGNNTVTTTSTGTTSSTSRTHDPNRNDDDNVNIHEATDQTTAMNASGTSGRINLNSDMIVPQLQHDQITFGELQIAVRVLNAISSLSKNQHKQQSNETNQNSSRRNHKRKNTNHDEVNHNSRQIPLNSDASSTSVVNQTASASTAPCSQGLAEKDEETTTTIKKESPNTSSQQPDTCTNEINNDATSDSDPVLSLYKHRNLRNIRKSLANCLEIHRRSMFNGLEEEKYYQQRLVNRTLKRQKLAETDLQRKFIQSTILRKGRIDKLNQLTLKQQTVDNEDDDENRQQDIDQAITIYDPNNTSNNGLVMTNSNKNMGKKQIMNEYMIPDGHVATECDLPRSTRHNDIGSCNSTNQTTAVADTTNNSNSNIHEQDKLHDETQSHDKVVLLPKLRSCYVCKRRYRELHVFYDQLCPSCASLNWIKRHQNVDLTNKIAIVTGSRVKIGYQVRCFLVVFLVSQCRSVDQLVASRSRAREYV
jgi:hypothetical protein